MPERKPFSRYLENATGRPIPDLTDDQNLTYNTAWKQLGLPERREVYLSHHAIHNPHGERLQSKLREQRVVDSLIVNNDHLFELAEDAKFVQELARKLNMSNERCAANLRAAARAYRGVFGTKKKSF